MGDLELGCFRLKEIIGEGSYGTSYLAEQVGFDRDAVVKIAHADLFQSRDAALVRRRFADELRAATRVKHPNLVTLYTAGETHDGLPAIAMELVPGNPMEDVLVAYGRGLPGPMVVSAFGQLGSAVAALHVAGVVHRDLSPRNVMLDAGPPVRAKVLDFGVAKLRGRPRQTYGAVGTPRYMAPEQVLGRAVPASDVFALGAMLWWALTGEEYRRDALTLEDLHDAALGPQSMADPRTVAEDLPPEVARLVGQMLMHGEERRPTASEFCERWRRVSGPLNTRMPRARVATPPPLPRLARDSRDTTGRTSAAPPPPSFGSFRQDRTTPPRSSSGAPRGPRALVVDANPITQHLLVGQMRRLGCRVRGTRDPREATRAAAEAFDLVVLSTEIPDASAVDVAQYLHEYHPSQWVVMAGHGERSEAMDAAGVRALVEVPSGFEELGELIDALRGELALRDSTKPQALDAIDPEVLGHLQQGDPQVIREAIELFVGQTPESLAKINDGHLHRDAKAIHQECRSLSTSARALGASHLARLAHAAAELVREGDLDCIPGFAAELEREYGLVFRALMQVHANPHQHGGSR